MTKARVIRVILIEGDEDAIDKMLEPSWLRQSEQKSVGGVTFREVYRSKEYLDQYGNAVPSTPSIVDPEKMH